jgi:formylglycine-generating enzyme required for sulfatase activity
MMEAVVMRCLAKHPKDRFTSVQNLLAALSESIEEAQGEIFTSKELHNQVTEEHKASFEMPVEAIDQMPKGAPHFSSLPVWARVAVIAAVVAGVLWIITGIGRNRVVIPIPVSNSEPPISPVTTMVVETSTIESQAHGIGCIYTVEAMDIYNIYSSSPGGAMRSIIQNFSLDSSEFDSNFSQIIDMDTNEPLDDPDMLVVGQQLYIPFINDERLCEDGGGTWDVLAAIESNTILTPTLSPAAGDIRISTIDRMEMFYIPAGSFMMGSENGDPDESPVHEVYLDAYWIDRYEVTNAMFAAFLNEEGNQLEGGEPWLTIRNTTRIFQSGEEWTVVSGYENHPATYVNWYAAQAYCTWVGRRLPTEAEWERAARGDDSQTYPWGNDDPNCQLGNFMSCTGYTSAIGSYPEGASPYGVQDMAGNVSEWVADWFNADYYASSPNSNPTGPSSGYLRVVRGGHWGSYGRTIRIASRRGQEPEDHWAYFLGFRCAQSAE